MKKVFFVIPLVSLIASLFFIYRIFFPPDRPNIILISIDTLRQDHVGAYGYERNTTPTLDKIASEGVIFRNSYSTAPWTLPSHMSMFTGLPPSVHKIDFDVKILDKTIKTFPEKLKERGYQTGGFISGVYLKHIYGFSRGFDIYKEMYGEGAEKITEKGIDWLNELDHSPFLLFMHYYDAHYPYRPPEKYADMMGVDKTSNRWLHYGRLSYLRNFSDPVIKMPLRVKERIIKLYDSEILRIDTNIGRLIAFLKDRKLYDSTIIVITSDHGEEFREHGSFGHYHQLYSEVINVPLIIRFPKKFPAGKIPEEHVSSVDISGTLLSLAGIDAPDQFREYGRDLLEITESGDGYSQSAGRILISETRKGSSYHLAFLSNNYKYITSYRFLPLLKNKKWVDVGTGLYQMNADREDLRNLISDRMSNELRSGIIEPFVNNLNAYLKKNIDSIRIIFFPPEKDTAILTGKLSYKNVSELTPFGVNFEIQDRISDSADGNSTDFRIILERDKKEILIRLSKSLYEKKDFQLKIYHREESIVDKKIDFSKLSNPEFLFKGISGSIYIMKNGTLNKNIKPGLTDREKTLLKSLGYIN